VFGDDGMGRGKPQPATGMFCGEIGVKYFSQMLLGDAGSLILDGNRDVFSGLKGEGGGTIQNSDCGIENVVLKMDIMTIALE